MPCCCGGCCQQAPQMIEHANGGDGDVVRINLLFVPQDFCSSEGSGLLDEPPKELFQNGFARATYDEWTEKLHKIKKIRASKCKDLCGCLLCVTFSCFTYYFCKARKSEISAWDKALRAWQYDFNSQVLNLYGIYVKTKSSCSATYGAIALATGIPRKDWYIERWIAFALEPEEITKLKSEPYLSGDIEDFGCCGGANESELCMHP